MRATNAWLLLHVHSLRAVTCSGGRTVLPGPVLPVQYKLSADLSIPRITCWQLCGLMVVPLCACFYRKRCCSDLASEELVGRGDPLKVQG